MRIRDGKEHRYWTRGSRVQRQVLYLGGINDSRRVAWCRTIDVIDQDVYPTAVSPAYSSRLTRPNAYQTAP